MKFVDRVPKYPGRYRVVHADGSIEYITMTRADEPSNTGTLLNAETFNGMIAELQSPVLDAEVV